MSWSIEDREHRRNPITGSETKVVDLLSDCRHGDRGSEIATRGWSGYSVHSH